MSSDDPTRTSARRYGAAAEAWLTALTITPQCSEAVYNLGVILYRAGYQTMAAALWRATVDMDPDFSIAWYNLGTLAARAGDTPRAERCWRHCSTLQKFDHDLLHAIVDLDRPKTDLTPENGSSASIAIDWLDTDRLMTVLARRMERLTPDRRADLVSLLSLGPLHPAGSSAESEWSASYLLDLLCEVRWLQAPDQNPSLAMTQALQEPPPPVRPLWERWAGPPPEVDHFPRLPLRSDWPVPGQPHHVPPQEIALEIGRDLLVLVWPKDNPPLFEVINEARTRLATRRGVVLPGLRIRDNLDLEPTVYRIVAGQEWGRWKLQLNSCFVTPCTQWRCFETATDPAFGQAGQWVPREALSGIKAGSAIFDAAAYLMHHILALAEAWSDVLLGEAETDAQLSTLKRNGWTLPSVPTGHLCAVLQRLLREQVSIADLVTIVRHCAREYGVGGSVEVQTERVRRRLKRTICAPYIDSSGRVPVHVLSRRLERHMRSALSFTQGDWVLNLPEHETQVLLLQLTFLPAHARHPLLVHPAIRPALKRLLAEHGWPHVPVLSTAELPRNLKPSIVSQVDA